MKLTRGEYIEWCKQRALAYVEKGDLVNALGSFISDLGKHNQTAEDPRIQTARASIMSGGSFSIEEVKNFINGFD